MECRKKTILASILIFSLGIVSAAKVDEAHSKEGPRAGRVKRCKIFPSAQMQSEINFFLQVLGLFNVIQFANKMCNGSDSSANQGVCYTTHECSSMGGRANGECAAGFGVCCICKI